MFQIVTGKINSGKSEWVYKFVQDKIANGENVSGWICRAHHKDGKKIGHDFLPIINSKILEQIPFSRLEPFKDSIQIGKFYLNKDVFDEVVPEIPKMGFFVVDEVGRLEMEHRKGFYPYLNEIFKSTDSQLIVVQKRVLASFKQEFGEPDIFIDLSEPA